jgi:hypothetical protein
MRFMRRWEKTIKSSMTQGGFVGYEIIGVANIGELDWLVFSLPLFRSEVKFSMVFWPWLSNV